MGLSKTCLTEMGPDSKTRSTIHCVCWGGGGGGRGGEQEVCQRLVRQKQSLTARGDVPYMAGGRWSMREEVSLKPPTAPAPEHPAPWDAISLLGCLGLQRGDLEEPAKRQVTLHCRFVIAHAAYTSADKSKLFKLRQDSSSSGADATDVYVHVSSLLCFCRRSAQTFRKFYKGGDRARPTGVTVI